MTEGYRDQGDIETLMACLEHNWPHPFWTFERGEPPAPDVLVLFKGDVAWGIDAKRPEPKNQHLCSVWVTKDQHLRFRQLEYPVMYVNMNDFKVLLAQDVPTSSTWVQKPDGSWGYGHTTSMKRLWDCDL